MIAKIVERASQPLVQETLFEERVTSIRRKKSDDVPVQGDSLLLPCSCPLCFPLLLSILTPPPQEPGALLQERHLQVQVRLAARLQSITAGLKQCLRLFKAQLVHSMHHQVVGDRDLYRRLKHDVPCQGCLAYALIICGFLLVIDGLAKERGEKVAEQQAPALMLFRRVPIKAVYHLSGEPSKSISIAKIKSEPAVPNEELASCEQVLVFE